MRMTKLTLSADKKLVEEAKEVAKREGTSLSSMFARFLDSVLKVRRKREQPGPITLKALGLVRLPKGRSDRELLEEALTEKYGR